MGRGSGGVMSSRTGTKSGYKSAQKMLDEGLAGLYVALSATKTPAGSVAKAKTKVQAAISKLSDKKLKSYHKSTSENSWLWSNPKAYDYNSPGNKSNRILAKMYAAEVKKRKLVIE